MSAYTFSNITDAWDYLINDLRARGKLASPRGIKTREILNASISYTGRPQYVFYNPVRHLNPVFHLVELFYFLNGRDDDVLCNYVSSMRMFLDKDSGRFDGSYGPQLALVLPRVLKYLKRDPSTRRAVVPILSARHLFDPTSKDVPCNDLLSLMVRDDRLNMTIVVRSQDVCRGFLYDTLEWQLLHFLLAKALGFGLGTYDYYALSLHMYEKDLKSLMEARGKTEENLSQPWGSALNIEAFWKYCRSMNAVIDHPKMGTKLLNNDMSRAIHSYHKRENSTAVGIYTDWVNKWLDNRESKSVKRPTVPV